MRSLSVIVFVAIFMIQFGCGQSEDQTSDLEKDIILEEEEEQVESRYSTESLYQTESEWHTHNFDTMQLSELRGKIPVVAMVFTNCAYACPRMVADLENIEAQIPEDLKDEVVFVLASFDTERDHPQRLNEYAKENEMGDNWLMLHGDEEDVRLLSMLLNVQYKKQPDGNFAHSNQITLLNKDGAIVEQIEGLETDPAPIVNKIKRLGKN